MRNVARICRPNVSENKLPTEPALTFNAVYTDLGFRAFGCNIFAVYRLADNET